jgi:phage terminase small subunit
MPKKIDKEKEQAFIEYFCEGDSAGNATKSAIKAGWSKDKSPRQMGAYLKNKYLNEIRQKNEERISGTSGLAISVLQDLLKSEQDSVRLNTAKLLLELGNFSSQTINLNVDNTHQKSDDELIAELNDLVKTIPNLQPKLQNLADVDEENNQINSNEQEDSKNIVKH